MRNQRTSRMESIGDEFDAKSGSRRWNYVNYELLLEATTRLKDSTDEPDAKPGSCQEVGESTGKPDAKSGSCRMRTNLMRKQGDTVNVSNVS